MSNESMEVKVAKLETKVDTILESVESINRKLDIADRNNVTREEFNKFKEELKRKRFSETLLTAIVTFVITALLGYVIANIVKGQGGI